jgi:transposase-like protein
MDFPITELMDEQACYDKLVGWLHPDGLACPRCHGADTSYVHRHDRAPILGYRCRACRRVYNAFTGTALQGTKRRPVALLLILRGFARGESTARLARELECDRLELLKFRHKLQGLAYRFRDLDPLEDADVEADEAYQNAGEKRRAASRPGGSAPAAGEQASRTRDVCQRPAAGLRRGRPRSR